MRSSRFFPVVILTGQQLTTEERRRLRARTTALMAKRPYPVGELRELIHRIVAAA
mgnify:CR=1 FL=1